MSTQAKHTPGEWTVLHGTIVVTNSPTLTSICEMPVAKWQRSLDGRGTDAKSELWPNGNRQWLQNNLDESKANMALICAAPELLAALIELETVESSPHSETRRYLAREQARAAIARATGGKAQ